MKAVLLDSEELVALGSEALQRGGRFCFVAQGNSMRPFIRHGDTLEIEPVAADQLRVGDIVLYATQNGKVACHRLVAASKTGEGSRLAFRGDASRQREEGIDGECVLGRVAEVRRGSKKCANSIPSKTNSGGKAGSR